MNNFVEMVEGHVQVFWKSFAADFMRMLDGAIDETLKKALPIIKEPTSLPKRVKHTIGPVVQQPPTTKTKKTKKPKKTSPAKVATKSKTPKPKKSIVRTPLHDQLIAAIASKAAELISTPDAKVAFADIWSNPSVTTGKTDLAHKMKVDRELQNLRKAGAITFGSDGWKVAGDVAIDGSES